MLTSSAYGGKGLFKRAGRGDKARIRRMKRQHLQTSNRQPGGMLAVRKAVFQRKLSGKSQEARNECLCWTSHNPLVPASFQMPERKDRILRVSGDPQTKRWKLLLSNSGDCKDDTVAQEVFVVTLVRNLVDLNQCPEQHPKSARQQVQARMLLGPHTHILHSSFMSTFFSEAQQYLGEPTEANSQHTPTSNQSLKASTV